MAANALEIRVKQDNRHVELNRFTESLESIVTALREIDRAATSGAKRAAWIIDDLRHSKEFLVVRITVRLDRQLKRTVDSLLLPIDALVSGARALTTDSELPRYYSESTVERLLRAGEPKRGINDVSLAVINGQAGQPVELSGSFRQNAAESIREYQTAYGSISGQLNLIAKGVRNNRIRVSVLDTTTQRAISGTAPAGMADRLRELWGHRVLLDGRVTRNRHGQPVRVTIRNVEALPEFDDERPNIDDLLGVAPDWTGGLSVDRYIEESRRG